MDPHHSDTGGGPHGVALPDGTVRVSVDVRRPVHAVWAALTDSDELRQWFGAVDPPMRAGCRTRVDFGDGDFFDVSVIGMTAPVVELEWSFLGVGTPHRVLWTADKQSAGTRVTVVDRDPGRGPAAAAGMVDGWSDFLLRLRGYVETGEPTRYDWRGDLDGEIDLSAPLDPLAPGVLLRWLPVATDGDRPSWFFIVDADGPRRFPVSDWSLDPVGTLTFAVALDPGGDALTRCTVESTLTFSGRRLSFRHTGWRETELPLHRVRGLRSRFAHTWRAALGSVGDLSAAITT